MAAWLKSISNGLVRAWLYIAGVFKILKTAIITKSWSCTKKCWGGHVCGQPLVYRSGSGLGFHWECGSCDVELRIDRDTCDHTLYIPCGVLESYGLEGSTLLEKLEQGLFEEIPCEEIVDWERTCGHVVKGIRCSEKLRQMQNNTRCVKVIDHMRDCGHQVRRLECWKVQEGLGKCTKLITWKRECGHVLKDIQCYAKTNMMNSKIGCSVIVMKKLSCGHEVPSECFKEGNVKDSDCGKVLTTRFPCGHLLRRKCPEPKPEKCDVIISTMKCPHAVKVVCSGKKCCLIPCPEKCVQISKCGHSCSMTCMHVGDHVCSKTKCDKVCPKGHPCNREHDCTSDCPPCSVRIPAIHPDCGHNMTAVCGDDVAKRKLEICSASCTKQYQCGHPCASTCGSHLRIPMPGCQGLTQPLCPGCDGKEHGQMLPCGHVCTQPCASHYVNGRFSCPPCKVKNIEKTCANGHKVLYECQSASNFCIVLTQVATTHSCGHSKVIRAPCNQPLNENRQRGNAEELQQKVVSAIKCSSVCGTNLEGCGHLCSAKCADCHKTWLHSRCARKSQDSLPCGHKSELCDEIAKRDYCRKKCSIRCSHSACFDDCGLPCAPCTDPCERGCRHIKCTKKCFEPCDFELCIQRCSEVLPCGHRCSGFCGEKCPPCVNCNQGEIARLNRRLVDESSLEDEIYVLLPDCGHAITSTILDKIMCGELQLDENKKNDFGFKRCPGAGCGAIIWNCDRYWRFLAPIQDNYNRSKVAKLVESKLYEEIYLSFPKLKQPTGIRTMLSSLKAHIRNKLYEPPDEKYQRGLPVMKYDVSTLEIESLKILHCVYASSAKMLRGIEKARNGVPDAAKLSFVRSLRLVIAKIESLQWPLHPQEIADIKQQMRKLTYFFFMVRCIDDRVLRLLERGVPASEVELKYYVDVLMSPFRLTKDDNEKLRKMFKGSALLKGEDSANYAQAMHVANRVANIMDF